MSRPTPRISLLKLAEYMGANPVRRRTIVRDQWDPPSQVVPLYRRAMAAALSFFRGGRDVDLLYAAAERLIKARPSSDWDARDLKNSVEALEHLANVLPKLDLADRIVGGRRRLDVLAMSNVEVSVRAHVRMVKLGAEPAQVGAVKLAFSKTRRLPDDEAQRAATILRYSLDCRLRDAAAVAAPALCQIVDVFHEEVHFAPSTFKRTVRRAEAACEEIALTWPGRDDWRSPPPPVYPLAS